MAERRQAVRARMSPYVDDPDFRLYVGDVRDVLATMPDESVHCVVTSPPYWGLRDYGTGVWDGGDEGCDHRDYSYPRDRETPGGRGGSMPMSEQVYKDVCGKCGARRVDRQIGLEATPDLYVANMVAVFREVRRVLRRDGTCWVNLGDSYAAQGGGKAEGQYEEKRVDGATYQFPRTPPAGLKPKDLVGIPWRVAFALQADGWYLRSDIIWAKPNPMPESVTDRPTKSHEYVFLLTRSPRYFFDQEAVRETSVIGTLPRNFGPQDKGDVRGDGNHRNGWTGDGGRNVRSVWEIATQPYPDAHFATFPEELPRRAILAGTSEYGVCPECGAPWERVIDRGELVGTDRGGNYNGRSVDAGVKVNPGTPGMAYENVTTGWAPSCGCKPPGSDALAWLDQDGEWEPTYAPVPATVLDPFLGSGTTAHVARKLGRRSIGVELNPDYAALCARRLQQLSLLA